MSFLQETTNSAVTFLRSFRHQPRDVGTFLPSGPVLARTIAEQVDPTLPGMVVELGPGTGAVTKALLERGIEPARLLLIEYSEDFIPFLRERFPEVVIIKANAFALKRLVMARSLAPLASVVSGLPMLNFPAEQGQQLVSDATQLLSPGGKFIQLTYAQSPSVKPPEGVKVSLAKRVWLNAPPASVWVYQR